MHANAPLTPEGRKRLCLRIDSGRPISHIAAEAGVSRRCLSKWYGRWSEFGEAGLGDHSSTPRSSPAITDDATGDLIEQIRRERKFGPARIAAILAVEHDIVIAGSTVHKVLVRRGLNRLSDLDPPTGEQLREVLRYEQAYQRDE